MQKNDAPKDLIKVEVAYALPSRQIIIPIEVEQGYTVAQAVEQSGIRKEFPQIEENDPMGIFSKKCKGTDVLNTGDRVEIYRPLIADPKEMRKLRAKNAKEEAKEISTD